MSFLRLSRCVVVACVSLVCLSCASEVDEDGPPTQARSAPILDGTVDQLATSVVAVYRDAGSKSEFCSGTMITADLVLTARHCVVDFARPGRAPCDEDEPTIAGAVAAAAEVSVFPETVPASPTSGRVVAEIWTPADDRVCGSDLALLRLATPLDNQRGVVLRLDAPPSVGEPLVVTGYGASVGGPDTTSGVRRTLGPAGVEVEAVGETGARTTVAGEWVISRGPCAGDSGSPAFDADGRSIGVMSRGNQATCTHMIYERLDVHADWLREQVRASADRLRTDVPAWAAEPAAPPPPATESGCALVGRSVGAGLSAGSPVARWSWLGGLGALALAGWRRRRDQVA
jgi:hypothetical protein